MSETLITEREVEIILAIADNDMNLSKVSRNIFYHRNAVEYNIDKIHKKTGLNPKNFYDLCALIQMVKGSEAAKSEN